MIKMFFSDNTYLCVLVGLWAKPQVWDRAALEWFFYKLALGNILAGNNFLL